MAAVKRVSRNVLVTVLLLSAVGFLFAIFGSREPSNQNKTLEEWLTELEGIPEAPPLEAIQAVRQIGTNAIPQLLKMMRCEDSALKQKVIALLRKQHIVRIRTRDATEQHLRAMLGFSALGPLARLALPGLQPLLWNPNTVRSAAVVLDEMGPEGVRAVTAALQSTNVVVRRETAGVLGAVGIIRFNTNATPEQLQMLRSQGEIAVPALLAAGGDPDEFVRARAAIALGLLGQKPELAIPALIKSLNENTGSWRVPSAAAKALGRFGADAVPAIPVLKQALENSDSRVSGRAADALRAIEDAANRAATN